MEKAIVRNNSGLLEKKRLAVEVLHHFDFLKALLLRFGQIWNAALSGGRAASGGR